MQPPPSQPTASQESDELARFRQEWQEELVRRRVEQAGSSSTGTGAHQDSEAPKSLNFSILPSSEPETSLTGHFKSIPVTKMMVNSLEMYRLAIYHEERGELNDALQLYKRAFRSNPDVDRFYHSEELRHIAADPRSTESSTSSHVHPITPTANSGIPQHIALKKQHTRHSSRTLKSIIVSFPNELYFCPEAENEPVPMEVLPVEVLVEVFRHMDIASLERFALVSRKARYITMDSSIWREIVHRTYKPPQVPDREAIFSILSRFSLDYRRTYVEQPRVRMDGVYIAVCHYTRPGTSENSWVNVDHSITYLRYLRFFPSGHVLSLLVNEEHGPSEIIPKLNPSLRMKGLFFGQWALEQRPSASIVSVSNLFEANGKTASSEPDDGFSGTETTLTIDSNCRYAFAMALSLSSRPLGRWNKLQIETYQSVNLETGDIRPIVLKHERPFWFSKVRSYATV